MSWLLKIKFKDGTIDQVEINQPTLREAESDFDISFPDTERIGSEEIKNTLDTDTFKQSDFDRIRERTCG